MTVDTTTKKSAFSETIFGSPVSCLLSAYNVWCGSDNQMGTSCESGVLPDVFFLKVTKQTRKRLLVHRGFVCSAECVCELSSFSFNFFGKRSLFLFKFLRSFPFLHRIG